MELQLPRTFFSRILLTVFGLLPVQAMAQGNQPPPPESQRAPAPAATTTTADTTQILYEEMEVDGRKAKVPLRTRIYSVEKPQTEIVIYFDRCKAATLKVNETERNSRLYEDISAIVKKLTSVKADRVCPDVTGVVKHQPKFHRSHIKITALDANDAEIGTQTIVYGPVEHLSLGIDLPVTNRKTLKYDQATQSLMPKDDSPALYLSLNYSLGDVLKQPDKLLWWERFDVKLMIAASRKPLDSYGVGVGYKLGGLKLPGFDLAGFTIFGGHFYTKSDAIVNGVAQTNQVTSKDWRVGISYDVGTGLKWLKL